MTLLRCALLLLPLTMAVGCASITGSKTQPVTITTVCEGTIIREVPCTLLNDKGQWTSKTPDAVIIQKSYGNLAVVCKMENSSGTANFVSKSNGGTWGNILAGGLIGYAVDSNSGAGFDYPAEVTVVLSSPCPTPTATNIKKME